MSKPKERILILDFGSQYSQLIARRVRELGVYSELHPFDVSEQFIRDFAPKGIILSGGPETVTLDDTPRAPEIVFQYGCPVLGICYGMQTMAIQLGGQVERAPEREFGYAEVTAKAPSPLWDNIYDRQNDAGEALLDMWMSHGDRVSALPPGFGIMGSTPNTPIAAMQCIEKNFYGVLFHLEVTHSKQGQPLLSRFVHDICGCSSQWSMDLILKDMHDNIRAQVKNDRVILGLSGGVDSSVVAALLHRAIGKQLTCVLVDNGLLRLNEVEQLQDVFKALGDISIIIVPAQELFLSALKNVSEPEEKRKIIGKLFIDVFLEEAKKLGDVRWLAQGTIYSDVIESAKTKAGKTHVIKSHHNVGGLPKNLPFQLLEPLRELFKDEVRALGLELGLPHGMMYRHPFPGPGLAVRVIGDITAERLHVLKHADAIFIETLREYGWYDKVSQAFAVFLPIKSVGVVGDARQYAEVIGLRAVQTVDFMTAHAAHLPHDLLDHVSQRIVNEVSGVSRVVYDISSKPPATIEWE